MRPLAEIAASARAEIFDENTHVTSSVLGPTKEEWAALFDAAAEHDARVTELLTSNNEMLERARTAERELKDANNAIAALTRLIGKAAAVAEVVPA